MEDQLDLIAKGEFIWYDLCKNCDEKFGGCCSQECHEFSKLSIEEQRKLRKDLNKAAPMLVFKDRVRPKLKDLSEKRRNS